MTAPRLDALVARARRRVRLNRALWATARALVVCAAAALLWLIASRALLLPELDAAVALVAVTAVVGTFVVASLGRIPDVWAARAADHWLGSRDLYATATELRSSDDPLAVRQVRAADEAAAGVDRLGAPLPSPRLLAAGAALAALSLVGGALPNPQDAERERRAAEKEAIAEQQEELREAAEELKASDSPEARHAGEELDALAESLDDATREEALDRLEQAQATLSERLSDDLSSRRTALSGLSRELSQDPLADGAGAGEQLESLAEDLASGEESADSELAERLERLADALEGLPEVADALRDGASAASSADAGAAAQALSGAASALGETSAGVASQEALAGAASAVDDAVAALGDGGQVASGGDAGEGSTSGEGSGSGDGSASDGSASGEGSGDGEGSGEGSGSGDGDGSGSGSGEGSGGGGGSPSGQVGADDGGNRDGTGSGSATGRGDQPHSDLDTDTVYDPEFLGGDGEDAPLPGGGDPGDEQIDLGPREGSGTRAPGLVPYTDVVGSYADEARRAVESGRYPPALRDAVREYFNRLGSGG